MRLLAPLALLLPALSGGCSLVELPFRATGKAIDWTTTSREEADRNHGRAIRRSEAEVRRHGCSDC